MPDHHLKAINTNLSYFTLRKIIGWCGLLLPWVTWIVSGNYETSISAYYYTVSGVVFTSVITILGVFLISYRGYQRKDEKISDNVITWLAGLLIILVAAVPARFPYNIADCPTPICHQSDFWGTIHFGSAAAFFIAMGYLSAFHFTRGHKPYSSDKYTRNIIYRLCGYGMWVVLVITGILYFVFNFQKTFTHLVFWAEVILLMLFGASWCIKGKALVDLGIQEEEA